MTAQIIQLSDFRPAPPAVASSRGRGMRLAPAAAATLARLNRGEVITSIGQIDKPTQRMLDRLTKKGWLAEGRCHAFPKVKRCWVAAPMLDEVLPAEYKF